MRLPRSALTSSTERQSPGIFESASAVAGSSGSVPGDDVQHVGQVGHRARDGAAEVGHPGQRLDAGAALETVGAAQRHQALRARRGVERVAGLRSHGRRREAAGHDAGRSAARGERRLRRIEHAPHLAPRVVGVVAARRVLLERRLADDHRAGLAQPRHLEGVARRVEVLEGEAAVRGRPCRTCRSCS